MAPPVSPRDPAPRRGESSPKKRVPSGADAGARHAGALGPAKFWEISPSNQEESSVDDGFSSVNHGISSVNHVKSH